MALTMTRTRTQTTLTKLAMLVANVHGELVLGEKLLAEARAVLAAQAEAARAVTPNLQESGTGQGQMTRAMSRARAAKGQVQAIERRRQELLELRDSLYATVRQFDPGLDPTDIGSDDGWLKKFGRGGGKTAVRRYLEALKSLP